MIDQFMVCISTAQQKFTFTVKKIIPKFQNVDRSVEKGIASRVDVKAITSDTLYEKLNEMLSNPMYKENVKILSKHFKDQKEPPLDRALFWIEWAVRNPNSSLLNRGKNLNFFQIQSIDVMGLLTVVTVALMYMVMLLLKKMFNFVFRKTKFVVNKDKSD